MRKKIPGSNAKEVEPRTAKENCGQISSVGLELNSPPRAERKEGEEKNPANFWPTSKCIARHAMNRCFRLEAEITAGSKEGKVFDDLSAVVRNCERRE
ncbi:hypothetical protein KM043_005222 [Ampulex compressa]|nr:hypothetical protein KM043_005222 [Ampulex compressa]